MNISFNSLKIYLQLILCFRNIYLSTATKKYFQQHGVEQQFITTKFTKLEVHSVLHCTQKCTIQTTCFGMNICKIGKKTICTLIKEELNENSVITLEPNCQAYKTVSHGLSCRQYVQDRCRPCQCFDNVSSHYMCQCDIPPFKIELRSGGFSGKKIKESYLKLNGIKHLIQKRGFTVFVIDPVKVLISSTQTFDTWGSVSSKTKMIKYLDLILNGTVIAIVVWDSAERYQDPESIAKLGATQSRVGFRSSYVFIGLKGTGKIAEHNGMNEMTSSSQLTVKLEWKFNAITGYVEIANTKTDNGSGTEA